MRKAINKFREIQVILMKVTHQELLTLSSSLYCEVIFFNYSTFDELVTPATAAHRWGLTDLYNTTFACVIDQKLLAGGYGICTFIPLLNPTETPESFRLHFCIAVDHHFDVLYARLKGESATDRSVLIKKNF